MFYIFEVRLRVQVGASEDIHYFHVLNFTTNDELPFSVPTLDVEVIARDGNTDYISQIRFDDVVTLQVCIRFSDYEKRVWENIFEGRVLSPSCQFGQQNTAKFFCVGHEYETSTALLETDHTYTSTDNIAIFLIASQEALHRLSANEPLISSGYYNSTRKTLTDYYIKGAQKYFKDLCLDIIKTTAYTWHMYANPKYNAANKLIEPVILEFFPLPTTPTTKYKIIQGTPRFISGEFQANGENVFTRAIEFGATLSGGQCKGVAEWAPSQNKYGIRTHVETNTGFGAGQTSTESGNKMCAYFAGGLVSSFCEPINSGQVTTFLTPTAKVGDYVETQIKSINLNGTAISNYFTVHKISHSYSDGQMPTTTFDLGYLIDDPDKYLLYFASSAKLSMSNFIS
jgi:hypothetical protein